MPSVYKRRMKGWPKNRPSLISQWLWRFKQRTRKPVTYFAHIPKTAGTSFIVLLDRFFEAESIYPHQLWRETKAIDANENRKYDLYRGHFGGGGVHVLTDRPIQYLTILRDPGSLALSTYQFVQRESNTKVHDLVKGGKMSFADFLAHPTTSVLVQNRMIRNISFDFESDPAAQEVFLSAETIEFLHEIIGKKKVVLTDEHRLDRAKNFIRGCQWFGLLERFDESMQLLCYVNHWPPIGASQKLNTRKDKASLTAEESRLLTDVNQQDQVLYEFASGVFEEQIRKMQTKIAKYRTDDNQSTDDLLDLSYQHHHTLTAGLSKGGRYGFDQILLGSQWHRRELMQPENEYFRWTGPSRHSTIDFWLEPLNYQLSLRIINATSVELLDDLQLKINCHELTWESTDEGLVRVLRVSFPANVIQANGVARLCFTCSEMQSHQKAFNSDDERLVGVAVHWIQFEHEH